MDYIALAQQLEEELIGIRMLTPDVVKQCNLAIELSRNLLTDFKEMVRKHGFKDEKEEIHFFKKIKTVPLENIVYHFELRTFEIKFPKTGIGLQKKYIEKKQKRLKPYFLTNLDFVQYVEQDKTYLDDKYFTRKYFKEYNIAHSHWYYRDPKSSSAMDLPLAKLRARHRLAKYYDERLANLGKVPETKRNGILLKWTGSSTDLTELSYALKFSMAVNFGNVPVGTIQAALEHTFNVRPGNPHKNMAEIKRRKKSRTKFTDDLKRGLLDKMDRDDC